MRFRLLPAALVLAAIASPRAAAADDGAALRRTPYAPIAGSPIPSSYDYETEKKAKSPGLVIAGAVVGGFGIAGALTGMVLMATDANGCPTKNLSNDPKNPYFVSVEPCPKTNRDIGLTTLSISSAVAAAGLAMVLVGIQPAEDAKSARARLVPAVAVGPTGGTLTWKF